MDLASTGQPVEEEEQDALESVHAQLRAKSLALMFGVGSVLLLLSLVTMDVERGRTLTATVAGTVMTIVVAFGGRRIPVWSLQLFLALGTVLIEWVIYGSGENTSTYTIFYFWIAIYAFQFFT